MSKYTPDEVDVLIKILKIKSPKKPKGKIIYDSNNKPILNKVEKTIRYLEQRHKFFNPTREMLEYIIGVVESSKQSPELVAKMKEDLLTKK